MHVYTYDEDCMHNGLCVLAQNMWLDKCLCLWLCLCVQTYTEESQVALFQEKHSE